jgi:hypothetical protein
LAGGVCDLTYDLRCDCERPASLVIADTQKVCGNPRARSWYFLTSTSCLNRGVVLALDIINVTITDVVDTDLENVTPQDGGSYNAGTRTITWNIGAVAVNASGTVHFTADIVSPLDDGTIIENTGTIDSDQTDPWDTNTTQTEVTYELVATRLVLLP